MLTVTNAWSQFQILHPGSIWRYSSGGQPPSDWNQENFIESGWPTAYTQMGYGDGDENTVLYPGPPLGNYTTYYFRRKVFIPDTSVYPGGYQISVKRDDGIVFYVNSLEVYRNNITSINPMYAETAYSFCLDDGDSWINFYIPSSMLHNGYNTFAAEVHQNETIGGDLTFDCGIIGLNNTIPINIRGPYLQSCTENSTVVKWRTNIASIGRVRYGTVLNTFTDSVDDVSSIYDHEITLDNLLPNTKYYYNVGAPSYPALQDTAQYFFTPPLTGSNYEIDIWVTGDCGTGYSNQLQTANEFSNVVGNKYIDAWLLLGDNAYLNGLDAEYQTNFFDIYKQYRYLQQTCIWPAPGNHDYYTAWNLDSRNTPYFNIFAVPDSAEAGGVVSGTESYYSYNLGNAHFISLDSYGTENSKKMYDTTSLQALWLQQDLSANNQMWTIVYWHHPPYTMGNHNSDTETDLVDVRSKLIVILERYKVDLVLCGHSHQYERSKLMKGHYGLETTFDSLMHHVSQSSGKYDGSVNSCPYYKNSSDSVNTGLVYVVAGNTGKYNNNTSPGWPHNAMYYSNTSNSGSLYLKINNNRLDLQMISQTGSIQDRFTMMKDVNRTYHMMVPISTPANLTASWLGSYYWENTGDTTQSITINFDHDSMVVVHDPVQCVADTFYINTFYTGEQKLEKKSIKIFPNPTDQKFNIKVPIKNEIAQVKLYSLSGSIVYETEVFLEHDNQLIDPGKLASGTYSVQVQIGKNIYCAKLLIE